MTLFRKPLQLAVLTAVLFTLAAHPATALTISLNNANPAISGYAGPYGTVNVTWIDTTHAAFTFTALDSPDGWHFLFGDGGTVGLNVNGAVTVQGDIPGGDVQGITAPTGPQAGAVAPGPWSLDPGSNLDGFGSFSFVLDNFDGFTHAVRTISFTLVNTSGTWANESAILSPNSTGSTAGAHIFVANADYTNTTVTGFAANGSVPDGGMTISLLGMALAGLGLLARRKS